jgi:hypothetical protein
VGGRLFIAVSLAVAFGVAPAHAATVTLDPETDPTFVSYRAAPGERNQLRIERAARAQLIFSDAGANVGAPPRCEKRDEHTVACPGGAVVDVALRDGDDSATVEGAVQTHIHGGTGRDELRGGGETDDLYGDRGNDVLDGGGDSDSVFGGPGSDSVFGGAGDDTEIVGGRGRDLMIGGDGFDQIDARDPGGDDSADAVGCGADGDLVDGRRPAHARVRDADLFTTDCEHLRLGLLGADVTVPSHPLSANGFALAFSCARRTFRLGCAAALLVRDGRRLLASGRRRLDNGRDTTVRVPRTQPSHSVEAPVPALVHIRYRAGHKQRTATFRLLIPPPA